MVIPRYMSKNMVILYVTCPKTWYLFVMSYHGITMVKNVHIQALWHLIYSKELQEYHNTAIWLCEEYSEWILSFFSTHTLFSRFSFCKHEFITHTHTHTRITDQTVTQIKANRSITNLSSIKTQTSPLSLSNDYYTAQRHSRFASRANGGYDKERLALAFRLI